MYDFIIEKRIKEDQDFAQRLQEAGIIGTGAGDPMVEIKLFMTDIRALHHDTSDRKKLAGEIYGMVKDSVNIIDAELSLPHFSAMIKAGYQVDDLLGRVSARYLGNNKLIERLAKHGHIDGNKDGFYGKLDEDGFKAVSNFLVTKTIEDYFSNKAVIFKIPQNQEYIRFEASTNSYEKTEFLSTSTDPSNPDLKDINLNTPEGKASFKLYFETFLVPYLKKNLKNNTFVNMLTTDSKRNSISASEYPYVKLNFNMSSITDDKIKNQNAEILFNGIKDGFESLKGMKVLGNDLWDMFAIYNVLINKNSFGSNSFTKLFQSTSIAQDLNARFYDFMKYTADLDLMGGELTEAIAKDDNFLKDLSMRSAKVEPYLKNIQKTGVLYMKLYNRETRRNDLYKRGKDSYEEQKLVNKGNDDYLIDDFISEVSNAERAGNANNAKDTTRKIVEHIKNGNLLTIINCD